MPPVKIRPAIPKPGQVEHEINNKIGVTFFAKFFRLHVVQLDRTLKLLNTFLYATYHLKEETCMVCPASIVENRTSLLQHINLSHSLGIF